MAYSLPLQAQAQLEQEMTQTGETLWVGGRGQWGGGGMHKRCGQAIGEIRNPGSISTSGFTDEDYTKWEV